MIVAVSDLHLGMNSQNGRVERRFENFLAYLKENLFRNGGDLVLLGDIFDFWRSDIKNVLLRSENIIEKLFAMESKEIFTHYVVGNHDFYMHTIAREECLPFFTIAKSLVLFNDSADSTAKFKFIHGYQLEILANPYIKDFKVYENLAQMLCMVSGITGQMSSGLWCLMHPIEYFSYKRSMTLPPEKRFNTKHKSIDSIEQLATSKARPLYIGKDSDDWLIFGHTHRPFVDFETRTANTGSTRSMPNNEIIYIKIDQGGPTIGIF
jgi:UDP-2,3-diacylglucosamine pyrophosphatase LpxH